MQLQNNIEKIILENYVEYQDLFIEFQSNFLTGLYSRYQSVENGNLVLYYVRQTHQDILRQKDYDLNFNINYEKLWKNHLEINPKAISIIKIAEQTLLPKETTRRKILQLIKLKVLDKKNRNIGWLPNKNYKQSYNLFINKEIEDVGRLIIFICKKLNYSISKEELTTEIKEKFSFYWFHYLGAQLEYLRLWRTQINDLELAHIFLQVAYLFTSKAKLENLSYEDLFDDPSVIKKSLVASISATSISDTTKIPRATCVRKLEVLVRLKMISQDKATKGYYIIPRAFSENLISQNVTKNAVKCFSNFFFICTRAMNTKILS